MSKLLKTAIYSKLSGDIQLENIVDGKCYPSFVPVGTKPPFLRYSIVSNTDEQAHDGALNFFNPRVQFDVFVNIAKHDQLEDISQRIKQIFNGMSETFSDLGLKINGSLDNETDLVEEQSKLLHKVIDFEFTTTETN